MSLPQTIVFDLDDCLWTPEMFTLSTLPNRPVTGPLGVAGEGIAGVQSGSRTVGLFPDALAVLQRIANEEVREQDG